MSVLFVDQYGDFGGGQRIVSGLARWGVEEGIRVAAVLPPGVVADELETAGVDVFRAPLPSLTAGRKGATDIARYLRAGRRIRRTLESVMDSWRPSVVHVNGGRVLSASLEAAHQAVPVTFHCHTAYMDPLAAWVFRRAQRKLAAIVSPSHTLAEWMNRRLRTERHKLRVVWNWVDDEFFDEGARRQQGSQISEDPVVLVHGRIAPIKGQIFAVRALESLRARGIDARLVIVGDADESDPGAVEYARVLRTHAADTPNHIQIRPHTRHVAEVMAGCSVGCVPSTGFFETFGLAAAESMASGLPVVATDAGALPETVSGGGIVVRQRTEGELVDALERLVSDSNLRRSLGAAARRVALERYRYSRQSAQVYGVLKEATGG